MKIAITTSSFAKFSSEPLDLLKAQGIEYVLNPHGRALKEAEIVNLEFISREDTYNLILGGRLNTNHAN